jgi:hypothetical protein
MATEVLVYEPSFQAVPEISEQFARQLRIAPAQVLSPVQVLSPAQVLDPLIPGVPILAVLPNYPWISYTPFMSPGNDAERLCSFIGSSPVPPGNVRGTGMARSPTKQNNCVVAEDHQVTLCQVDELHCRYSDAGEMTQWLPRPLQRWLTCSSSRMCVSTPFMSHFPQLPLRHSALHKHILVNVIE